MKLSKNLYVLLLSASLSIFVTACGGGGSGSNSDSEAQNTQDNSENTSDNSNDPQKENDSNSSDASDLINYGNPATKTNLYADFDGEEGNEVADPNFPAFSNTVYLNLTDGTYSLDNVSYNDLNLSSLASTTIMDDLVVSQNDGVISIDASQISDPTQYILTGTLENGST